MRELSEPILQGDVFQWTNDGSDPWRRFGIIITADCDLAHGKYGNSLSYCPIMTFADFLKIFWVYNDLNKWKLIHGEKVAKDLTKARGINRPELTEPIQCDTLIRWLERRGISGVLEDIHEPVGKSRTKLEADLTKLLEIIKSSLQHDLPSQLATIAKAKHPKPSPTDEEISKGIQSLWQTYKDKFNKLQGDLFFLNELSPIHREGYIVYLRRIAEIKPESIAINTITQRTSEATRVSQLRATFRYRVTQKLAAVFTDIGLPVAYEAYCAETINNIASTLGIVNS